jgi:hypothetical protein
MDSAGATVYRHGPVCLNCQTVVASSFSHLLDLCGRGARYA